MHGGVTVSSRGDIEMGDLDFAPLRDARWILPLVEEKAEILVVSHLLKIVVEFHVVRLRS